MNKEHDRLTAYCRFPDYRKLQPGLGIVFLFAALLDLRAAIAFGFFFSLFRSLGEDLCGLPADRR